MEFNPLMTANFEQISRSVPRSLTPNIVQTSYNKQMFHPDLDGSRRVHLIQSDLWEAITGEHLTPANICQLCDISIPGIEASSNSSTAIQYITMAKDRQGSRVLQQKIQECSPADREVIFGALLPHLKDLVYDPSTNYVIQKLCDYATAEHQQIFLNYFLSDLQRAVDHPNGCRVLQKFIETTSEQNIDAIYVALRPNLIQLCFSQNGNHIVQRFIETLKNRLSEIVEILEPHVEQLVIDNCGCRVIQRLFDKYEIEQLRPLVNDVLGCAADLASNQYGNYVVQNILESGTDEDITQLIYAFSGGFYSFSIHKFASNVIEKCIRRANDAQKDAIFAEIIGTDGTYQNDRILHMVADQFGNYVIQRIIEFGTESQQNAIYTVVYDNYDELYTRQYARHVINKLENLGYDF